MPSECIRKNFELPRASGLQQTFQILEDVAALVYTCGYDVCIFAEKSTPVKKQWKTVNFGYELSHVEKTRIYLSGFKIPETNNVDRGPVNEHEVWAEDELVNEPKDVLVESEGNLESAEMEDPVLLTDIKMEPQVKSTPVDAVAYSTVADLQRGAEQEAENQEREAVMEEQGENWEVAGEREETETEICSAVGAEMRPHGDAGEQESCTDTASNAWTLVKETDLGHEYPLEEPVDVLSVEVETDPFRPATTQRDTSRPAQTQIAAFRPALTQRDISRPAQTQRGTRTRRTFKSTGRSSRSTQKQKCTMCNFETIYTSHLRRHMLTHTGEKPFECALCDYSCRQSSNLRSHNIRAHTGEQSFKCSQCFFSSADLGTLTIHMRTHTGEREWSEAESSRPATIQRDTSRPATIQRDTSGPATIQRGTSGPGEAQRDTFNHNNHKSTECSSKSTLRYPCTICNYGTNDASMLIRHMRTHTGEKPYPCSECDFRTAQLGSLNRHMRTHTGEKPHPCSLCNYKSAHKSNLRNHMRTHTGERPYKCTQCSYSAAQPRSLTVHLRAWHTGKPPSVRYVT